MRVCGCYHFGPISSLFTLQFTFVPQEENTKEVSSQTKNTALQTWGDLEKTISAWFFPIPTNFLVRNIVSFFGGGVGFSCCAAFFI